MKKLEFSIGGKIRKLRQENNLSIQRLAELSGVSPASIYKIETNAMVPSIITMLKITRALGRKISYFVEDFEKIKDVGLVRSGKRQKMYSNEAKTEGELLSTNLEGCKLIVSMLNIDVGGTSGMEAISHQGEEFVLCLKGKIEYTIKDNKYILSKGDSLHYKTENLHCWRNIGSSPAQLLYVMTPAPLSGEASQV